LLEQLSIARIDAQHLGDHHDRERRGERRYQVDFLVAW